MRAIESYPSTFFRNGTPKRVKNLGWLLRNWNEVRHFTIRTKIAGKPLQGTLLVAWLSSGDEDLYYSGWEGDLDHVVSWLRRPVFHGLKAYVDPEGPASKPEQCNAVSTITL